MARKRKLTDGNYDFSVVTKEHVLSAIQKIDKSGVTSGAQSTTYDLIYKNKAYPPKLVLSLAYGFAMGRDADRTLFEGGRGTACFNCLEGLGFLIQPKMRSHFKSILSTFIQQANEHQNLKINSYPKSYEGLKMVVSFGKGNFARIPWISFCMKAKQLVRESIH